MVFVIYWWALQACSKGNINKYFIFGTRTFFEISEGSKYFDKERLALLQRSIAILAPFTRDLAIIMI